MTAIHQETIEHLRQTVEQLYTALEMIKTRERLLVMVLIFIALRICVNLVANLICLKLKKRIPKWLDIII